MSTKGIEDILAELDTLSSLNNTNENEEDIFEANVQFNNRDDANTFITQWSRYNRLSITMVTVENLVNITNVSNKDKNWINNYISNLDNQNIKKESNEVIKDKKIKRNK